MVKLCTLMGGTSLPVTQDKTDMGKRSLFIKELAAVYKKMQRFEDNGGRSLFEDTVAAAAP